MHGDDGYSILKQSFHIFNADRTPIFRIWVFKNTGPNYRVYQTRMFEVSDFRSKDFAALYELDLESIDTTFEIINKKSKEYKPKSGWVKFNTKIKQHEVWDIPRFMFTDSINEERYSKQGIEIEFVTPMESYSVSVSGILNLGTLHDKKSVAITSLFRIMKEEFGIDFLKFDFDGKY